MTHRYLHPTWWVKRLARLAERIFPPPWIMPALAQAVRYSDEPELAQLVDVVPADRLAVDVGAADGVYTWYLSRLAASCVAFEANPQSADRIRRRVPGATVQAVALSDTDGEILLRVPIVGKVPYLGWATIEAANAFATLAPDGVETLNVPMRTLDSFGLQNVGFIKIDVEGHELAVLRGATETIRCWRPTILLEMEDRHREGTVAQVHTWFRQAGYTASLPESKTGSVTDSKKIVARDRNVLFKPSEKMT